MNTKQIQFNRQWVAAFLLAGSILAATAGLVWVGADASGSTFLGHESELLPWSQPRFVEGSKPGGTGDGVSSTGSDSGLLPSSQLRSIKGSKPGIGSGSN
jgi:hypothetical protein